MKSVGPGHVTADGTAGGGTAVGPNRHLARSVFPGQGWTARTIPDEFRRQSPTREPEAAARLGHGPDGPCPRPDDSGG
jgi:hypothetical protein